MTEEKKFIPSWKIYSPADLSKNWFIYYRKDGKRCERTYGGINKHKTYKERMDAAKALIKLKTSSFSIEWKIYSPTDLSKKWFIYYRKDGKRCQRTYGSINQHSTFEDRMKAAKALIKEKQANPTIIVEDKSLSDKMFGFLRNKKAIYRKSTYGTYKSKIKLFLEWLDERPLTEDEIKEFFIYISERNHRTTYNLYRRTLKKVLEGIGHHDLFDSIHKVKTSQTPARYFQSYQIRRLKKHLSEYHPKLWMFCQYIYYCFLRPGEIRQLKVGDIDLDRWRIRVKGEVAKNWNYENVCIPKNFRKTVFLSLDGRAPSEYLFPSERNDHKPIGAKTMTSRHKKILRELGFGEEYKLYSWKHTGAVACVEQGINIKHLQIHLRHHDLETVDKYLRQLGVNNIKELEERFPAL